MNIPELRDLVLMGTALIFAGIALAVLSAVAWVVLAAIG